ncbi:cobyrinate a,c-diamide synthase [Marinifilum caeruleilacunae]|uniref:Cobyrinate a,c-diamide synthase n=1 Tax=Marinifilum caeruleilacunae TaxID=2499076 RepID=A0ABX1WYX9_9BACT|nr:cobyrinate a,c-diamide synthase [Marinifilum caeruleilacunae]NOU61126.1 cobyrinate a,c-diamide synthase [Marinifilum caeruleilacunae]
MDKKTTNAFLIAAPKSNSGKTMITLGLMQTFVDRGFKVQPFKCGPDYIDPMHHTKIAGQPSYNLDLWMANEAHVQGIFEREASKANVSVAEGVMGLFDGAQKDQGSSAALARMLNLPVILVVDASSTAYSVAPLLYGFKHFDSRINLAGVIFNKVAGESHFQFLKEAAIDAGVPTLGYMPRDQRLAIESRHLGLHLPGENQNREIVNIAAGLLEKHVDIDLLLQITNKEISESEVQSKTEQKHLKIALANDEAFNFSYQANRDVLAELGEVTEFSPLSDTDLPAADLLWLPGGYPELFAEKLAENVRMKQAIADYIEAGKAVVAECGGMMYLGKNIITKAGEIYKMTGVFDFDTSFENMKLHLGYRELVGDETNIKGHEFHYSNLIGEEEASTAYQAKTARGKDIEMPVYRKKNCWASYMHLYLGEQNKMCAFLKELNL